jgi:hypothetical protein
MKTKFTPGPWTTEQASETGAYSIYILTEQGFREGYPWIATVQGTNVGPKDLDEIAANGNLIAAAPEMYEAGTDLNILVNAAISILAEYLPPDSKFTAEDAINELLGLFDGPLQRKAQSAWNAALAKAEGKQESNA